MAHQTADRVQDTSATTGTGTLTVANSAPTGYQTFGSVMSTNDTCYYTIAHQSLGQWETGLGTYNASGPTLARTTVITGSSGAGVAVNFSSGGLNVFMAPLAERTLVADNTKTFPLPDFTTTTPTTPTGTSAGLFGRQIANRKLTAMIDPFGDSFSMQPFLARQGVAWWNPPGGATTVPGVVGFTAPTAEGGPGAVARSIATTSAITRFRRLGYQSSASAGALCGHHVAVAQYTTGSGSSGDGSGFFYICQFIISEAAAVSGSRMFVGLSNSIAAASNVEPSSLTNCAGVAQISTDSTQLYIVYGGSSAQSAIALGTNFPPTSNNAHAFEIALYSPNQGTNNEIFYQVTCIDTGNVATGTLSGTGGTTTPAATTLLAHRAWRTNNANTGQVAIDICKVYIESNN